MDARTHDCGKTAHLAWPYRAACECPSAPTKSHSGTMRICSSKGSLKEPAHANTGRLLNRISHAPARGSHQQASRLVHSCLVGHISCPNQAILRASSTGNASSPAWVHIKKRQRNSPLLKQPRPFPAHADAAPRDKDRIDELLRSDMSAPVG